MQITFLEPLGVCECVLSPLLQPLEQTGHRVKVYPDRTEDEDELIKRAQHAEIVVISNIPLKKRFLDACPHLRMIAVAFTGIDHIDLEECNRRGIIVKNAAGYATEAVAELTIGMMIAVYRKIIGGDAITRICGSRENFLGSEIHGKTVGIIGLGKIGQKVAQLAAAFSCRILAYNRSPKSIAGIQQVDKTTLLQQSDIITIHLPLTAETKDFIGESEFTQMSPQAILINTSRGAVVNTPALYQALRKGHIAGAAVDVYDQEPPLPANHELFNAPNLIMLPHMGYATKEAFNKRIHIVVNNIKEWIQQNN